jgi:deoxynucleoside triphosphate triphosphohydrolase SAMHD1
VSRKSEMFGHPSSIVMDPVHQGIHLYDHERECIDHPLFQRLRWIVQNDVTMFVFPGATHSRFQHSIGAMHIAGLLFQGIVQQHLAEKSFAHSPYINADDRDSINYLLFCLRLASLLHDTGHFPFSHQLERQSVFREMICSPAVQAKLWAGNERQGVIGDVTQVHHEHYSLRMAAKILDGASNLAVNAADVLFLMENTAVKSTERFSKASTALCRLLLKKPDEVAGLEGKSSQFVGGFLRTLVSGELDVDKMDYLLRDSYYAGCHYGFYNLSRLISTIRIGFDFRASEPWVGMAITEKGVKDLEDLCYSRFQLYQQIYSHKTVVGFKWLLQQAISELLTGDSVTRAQVLEAVSNVEDFKDFTDSYMWERMRAFARGQPNSACAHLINRRKLEYLETAEDLEEGDIRNRLDELSSANSSCGIVHFESPIKFSKIGPGFSQIKVLSRNRHTKKRQLDSLQSHSSFFKQFGAGVRLIHFFKQPAIDLVQASD